MSFVRLGLRQLPLAPRTAPLRSVRAFSLSNTRPRSVLSLRTRPRPRWPGALVLGLVPLVHAVSDGSDPSSSSESLSPEIQDLSPSEEEPGQAPSWRITRCLDDWILEPLATLRRLVHLFALFLPALVIAPVLLLEFMVSPREGDEELASTRFWYRLLVAQMERAGPTFIKVRL
jgi:hypothetical protein